MLVGAIAAAAARLDKGVVVLLAAPVAHTVAEAPWSEAEWAVGLRFDHPRGTVLVLVLG